MLKERSQSYFFHLAVYDFLSSIAAFALAMLVRFWLQDPQLIDFRLLDHSMYAFLGIGLAFVQLIGFFGMGLYRIRRHSTSGNEITRIVTAVGINVLVVISGLYFARLEHISRFTIIYYAFFDAAIVSGRHVVIRRLAKLFRRRYSRRRVMVIGTGNAADRIAEIIRRNSVLGFDILGYVDDSVDSASNPAAESRVETPVIGTVTDLETLVEKYHPDMVVYTSTDQSDDRLMPVLDVCDQAGVSLKIVPGFSGLIAAGGDVETVEGVPVLSIREAPARIGFNRFVKRAFDIAFSLTVIVVLSPIHLLVALIIKISSPGPVLYTQERVGLDNRPFKMLKFRTMRVQDRSESETTWTTKNDPRVTLIGGIMRKLSIDELPQFLNVLAGDMSVVGPRPERPFFVEQFRGTYRHYMRRHAMKAGITGWAQINGLRGDTSIEKRVRADIYYIENWSFWLDIKIIVLTPFKGMINQNAY